MKINPFLWKLTFVSALLIECFFGAQKENRKFIVKNNSSQTNSFTESKIEKSLESVLTTQVEMSHAPSLAELPDGGLIAAWYAGSREGAKDVKIWFSIADKDRKWQPPKILLDKETLQKQTGRFIRKLGNPVLYMQENKLHCWIVSVSYGGWSGSSLNHAVSEDGGKTWSSFQRMKISPLFNVSNLVRVPPVPMDNGMIGLPLYHEMMLKYCQFLTLNTDGKILGRSLIPTQKEALQPTVVALDSQSAVALMRNASKDKEKKIMIAQTHDAGKTWQMLPDLSLNNSDSSLALTRSFSGDLFLAANSGKDRSTIELFRGSDKDLSHWTRLLQLENSPNQEFSYPSLLVEQDGSLGLVYTWKRKGIKYQRFRTENTVNANGINNSAYNKNGKSYQK